MTELTLSDVVDLSQIAGAVAVIASLIFVGLQIRHNTTTARAATLQANAQYWQDFFAMAADPVYGKSYARGAAGRADLTGEEFGQFFFLCRAVFMGCENQHYQFTRGLIDADAYRGYEATIREQIAAQPGVRAMWTLVRHSYGTEFQTFFDRQVALAEERAAQSAHDVSMLRRWQERLPTPPPHAAN